MTTPLYVMAKFRIKKDQLSAANTLMQNLITQTLQNEAHCISYTYLQNSAIENEFSSLELWQDANSEAQHWQMPHLIEALQQLPTMLENTPEITKWHRI